MCSLHCKHLLTSGSVLSWQLAAVQPNDIGDRQTTVLKAFAQCATQRFEIASQRSVFDSGRGGLPKRFAVAVF